MTDKAVDVRELVYSYRATRFSPERRALNGVSFQAKAGESVALLGPNGSGKSTLFQVLSTILPPQTGDARIDGFNVAQSPEQVRRVIGVVFQNPSVDKKLTVDENLACQGRLYGLHGDDLSRRMAAQRKHFGLEDRRDDLVETLSGGLRRRVELAKSLLHDPRVLLLDEPSNGLDPASRRDLWQAVFTLQRERGLTVMMTTHWMEEADAFQRVIILNQGSVVADGAPASLKADVGGDVLQLETPDPQTLLPRVSSMVNAPARIADGKIHVEVRDAAAAIAPLSARFPEISAIRLSKPSLEDVFLQKTGAAFREHEDRL